MKKCLMTILLIVLLMPMIYATPANPSAQELYSEIDPSLYYPGSAVKEFAEKIIEEADMAIRGAYYQGKIDGAAEAATPLLIEISGLKAWKDGAEDKLLGNFLKTALFVVGGIAAGFVIGVIVW